MDGRYRLYFEDELLGVYDDLESVVEAIKEETRNDQRNNHKDSDEAVHAGRGQTAAERLQSDGHWLSCRNCIQLSVRSGAVHGQSGILWNRMHAADLLLLEHGDDV